MSDPGADWYHRYHQRWLGGVRGLTCRQIAVYDIVTELIYQDGGETPNNPKYIAGFFSDLGTAAVRKTISELIKLGKLTENDGKISNKFAKNEAKTKEKLRENRSKSGKKGNKIRWKNPENPNENNETPSQERLHEPSQIREEKRREEDSQQEDDSQFTLIDLSRQQDCPKPAKRRISYPPDFEEFWAGFPTDANMSKKEALDEWKKLDPESRQNATASLPGFRAYCQSQPDYRPIHACRYLSKRRFEGHLEPQTTGGRSLDELREIMHA